MCQKMRFHLILLLLLPPGCTFSYEAGAPQKPPAAAAGWESYGEGVSLSERTPIDSILSRPDEFAGRTVAVEGTVVAVCKMAGCWIELEDENARRLRVKVEDGVIVFPGAASGKRAVAQGKVERFSYSKEDYLARARHESEERGEEFDPESVSPPYEVIQLKGTGAQVERGT